MNLEIYIERIENYLTGKLPENERKAFEAELETNAELGEAMELYRISDEAIELAVENSLRSQLKQWDAEDAATKANGGGGVGEAPIIPLRRTWMRWAAAAVVVGLVGLFVWLWNTGGQGPDDLFAQNYEIATPPNIRSTNGGAHPLTTGFEAYEKGNFTAAADFFKTISTDNGHFAEAQYYLGHSYLQLQKPLDAMAAFGQSVKTNDGKYREKAEWNLLLAQLASHRIDRDFEALLRKIAGDANHSFSGKAQRLEEGLSE